MNRRHWLALLLLTGLALAFRLPDLGHRPLHNDEAVNAFKLRDLWLKGEYRYDADEFHGPALHYLSLPFVWLSGARNFEELTEVRLRLVTVGAGVALVLLALLFSDGLGQGATRVAAGLTAVSPAMVFYSRYFIHEMLLVAFTTLAIGAGWRWWRSRRIGWAIASGVGFGLMYATKETFVFSVAAALLACATIVVWQRFASRTQPNDAELDNAASPWWRGVAAFLLPATLVSIGLFTSFFANPDGLKDSFRTYFIWMDRAGGASPHIHDWSFYFERLLWFHQPKGRIWSEGLVLLLALAGGVAGLSGSGVSPRGIWLARWLLIYSLVLTAVYCLIPYKTPWCLLGFYHGWILLAGVGAAAVWHWLRVNATRVVYAGLLCGAVGCLGWQAWLASLEFSSARQNPYVYAQTAPGLRDLAARVDGIARVHPSGNQMVVQVMAPESDYWPLPYYLRALANTDWRDSVLGAGESLAPVIIASTRFGAGFDEKSNRRWLMAGLYELRPGTFLELYVELELWKQYVAGLPRPRD